MEQFPRLLALRGGHHAIAVDTQDVCNKVSDDEFILND
jgi:hypothetical protein